MKNISQLVTPFTGIDPAADLIAIWDASAGKTVPVPVKEIWAPTGTVLPFAGVAAPAGWVLCFGQYVLKATYPTLWAAIGDTYGTSDATHFTLPDLRGRVVAGLDNMGGVSANRLGALVESVDASVLGAFGGAEGITLGSDNTDQLPNVNGESVDNDGDLSTVVAVTSLAPAAAPHANVQPTIVLNYIIKV